MQLISEVWTVWIFRAKLKLLNSIGNAIKNLKKAQILSQPPEPYHILMFSLPPRSLMTPRGKLSTRSEKIVCDEQITQVK